MKVILFYLKTQKQQEVSEIESFRFFNGVLTIILKDGGFTKIDQNETPFSFQIYVDDN
jgi:hypothetical protein